MTLREYALKLRPLIEKAATGLDDEDALEAQALFPIWVGEGHYNIGDRRRYNGILYKCLQAHDALPNWNPVDAPSLWSKVLIPSDDQGQQTDIPEWEQPDSTNAYKTGDMVMYKGKIYRSLIDNNVWSPEAYPSGWEEVNL